MGPVTKADKDRWAERIRNASARCNIVPSGECKDRLTATDISEIKSIAAALKRLSGLSFGRKNTMMGYDLRELHKRLDAILFGRV